MGNKASKSAQGEYPAGSPASTMAGLHGPEINKWSPLWQKETQRLHLATWPLQGSFQSEKLDAVRTVLHKTARSGKGATQQLVAFTLWAEQGRLENAQRTLKAQQLLEKKLQVQNTERKKLREDTGRKPSSHLFPVQPSKLHVPPEDVLDYPTISPPSYSEPSAPAQAIPSAPAPEPIVAPAVPTSSLPAPSATPAPPAPMLPNLRQARALRRLEAHLPDTLPPTVNLPRTRSGSSKQEIVLTEYPELHADLREAREFVAHELALPTVRDTAVLEYIMSKAADDYPGEEEERPLVIVAPMRTVAAPQGYTFATVHQPWTPHEIISLKGTFPPIRKDPKKFLTLMRDIIHTYQPSLADMRQLLRVLLSEDQLAVVMTKANWTADMNLQDTPERTVDNVVTQANPQLTVKLGQILTALEGLCPAVTDFEKIRSCKINKGEDVAEFLERVKQCYVQYSGMTDPVTTARPLIVAQFVEGLHPKACQDIKKLCVGWDGLDYTGILAQARHYSNIYQKEKEEIKERLMALQVTSLELQTEAGATASPALPAIGDMALQMAHQVNRYQGQSRGPSRDPGMYPHQLPGPPQASGYPYPQLHPLPPQPQGLGQILRNQCIYCKQFGHWKHNCPSRPPRPPQYSQQVMGPPQNFQQTATPVSANPAVPPQQQTGPVQTPHYPYQVYPPPASAGPPPGPGPAQPQPSAPPAQAGQVLQAGNQGNPFQFSS